MIFDSAYHDRARRRLLAAIRDNRLDGHATVLVTDLISALGLDFDAIADERERARNARQTKIEGT